MSEGPEMAIFRGVFGAAFDDLVRVPTATSPRRGRGKSAKSMALVDAAYDILAVIQPATVRAVCYRLFTMGLIKSMTKNETNKVSTQLVWAREQGLIPWEWVVDETREVESVATWDNPAEIIKQAVSQYRKSYWTTQSHRIEVWSEKGTVRGTLKPVLDEYGVAFRVMHGFGSATAVHDIAELSTDDNKPLTALYVGDWDPSGLCMSEQDLPTRIERYHGEVEIVRVALDRGDVGQHTELPSFPLESKAKDPRCKWFRANFGSRCWELDALSPVTLRERVREHIVALLDVDAWNHAVKVERAERESMTDVLSVWETISRQAGKYPGAAL